ncbi:MAG: TonB-dependent receptor [Brevinematales bacterium]|nr:TonB-dependent receptor [Brevinematales bacterium]
MVLYVLCPLSGKALLLEGRLVHRLTLLPVPNGTVILSVSNHLPRFATSDESGRFIFDDVPQGFLVLETKAVGFYPEKISFVLQRNTVFPIYLTPLPTASGGEIEVTAERQRAIPKTTVGRTDIQKSSASLTSDPLDTLKKMPGVESIASRDLSTGSKLSVRGGEGFETAADLDGLFLVSFFHRGLLPDSLFIDDMIEEMALYKGVAPADYGQILSGFLAVRQINPPVGFHGKFNCGLLSTYLTLYGKTSDERWQWATGIRRTHYDLVLPLFFQETTDTRAVQVPYYLDSHGKVQYKTFSDEFLLSYLVSLEPGYFTNLEPTREIKGRFFYLYAGINLAWIHRWSSNLMIEQSLSFLHHDTTAGLDFQTNVKTHLRDTGILSRYRVVPRFFLSEDFSLVGGGEVMVYPHLAYSNLIRGTYTNILTLQVEATNFAEVSAQTNTTFFAVFGGLEWSLWEKQVILSPGFRVGYFPVVRRVSFDPRINAEWRLSRENILFMGVGHLSQWPTEPYLFAFYTSNQQYREIPGVWHAVIGTRLLFNDFWEITTETYAKHYENPVTRTSNLHMEFQSGGMKKEIVGIELLLRKRKGGIPWYGWISGSLMNQWFFLEEGIDPNSFSGVSISVDEQGTMQSGILSAWQFDQPPRGRWFSIPSYKANLTAMWDFAKNWSLTVEFRYESRGVVTPVEGADVLLIGTNAVYVPRYGAFLSEKLPDSHQLNLKLEWTPLWFGLPCGIYLQVMNIYNFRDVFYTYTPDYSLRKTNFSPLGIYGYGGVWVRW